MARAWLIPVLVVGMVSLGILGYDRRQGIYWVGATDLEIEFVVTDSATGQPVDAAEIAVVSEGGLYREREEKQFRLVTDQEGSVRRTCHHSMCFGKQSGLRFTDTYGIHLPWWSFQVCAPGYESTDWRYLEPQEFEHRVQRTGSGRARLVVEVALQRAVN